MTGTIATSVLGAESWIDAITAKPFEAAVGAVGLAAVAVAAGLALRAITRRTRSVRHLVLAIALTSLAIGAAAAVLLARLMVLDGGEARTVVGVLATTAVFAILLALVASVPLGRDARRLETTVRRLESGDRTVRTGVRRADELGHVARALDELTERLDQLERERAGFEEERRLMLSSVGHDLRTPLAALRVAIEAMADGVAPDPERYLRSMSRDVEALGSLVDDLFLVSSIESGRLELHREPLDLSELADEAVEALAPAAATRRITLRLRAPGRVTVDGNATAIGRIIRNLIDNAIRHAPDGSTIEVAVAEDGAPTVRVLDDGPGFPAGFSARAFERFARADVSRTRATGGAGLGLAIARGLVEAQGGRIWAENRPSGGVRVSFTLPAA
ncbi:MAG: HAMP domain-containing histidine kinase [Acidimicrobiia bacterium]|nr:HAMP domain-containing histidine kinase [Acidimicrobiia bacterium]